MPILPPNQQHQSTAENQYLFADTINLNKNKCAFTEASEVSPTQQLGVLYHIGQRYSLLPQRIHHLALNTENIH